MTFIRDLSRGLGYGVWFSRYHIIHSFVIIPAGILVLLMILYGFNVLLSDIAKVRFPSSVLCMLINLLILVILSILSNFQNSRNPATRTWRNKLGRYASWILEHYLMIIRPSMNFSLKWINVFFIPSFIILPLSDSITFVECMKIAAVFIIGGVFLMVFNVYMIISLRKALVFLGFTSFNSYKVDPENKGLNETEDKIEHSDLDQSYILARKDITTIDLHSLRPVRTEPTKEFGQTTHSENPFRDQAGENLNLQTFATTPNMLPVPNETPSSRQRQQNGTTVSCLDLVSSTMTHTKDLSGTTKSVAIFITNYIDWILYASLLVGALPFYYINAIHVMLPFHLALTVISYYNAILLLEKFPKAKKFAHPILILTAEILFVCFISSLIYHRGSPKGFLDDLKYYKTGKNYLNLFNGKVMYDNGKVVPKLEQNFTAQPLWPGCGDFLSSLMDISIVSLSLPMFTHRKDFLNNFWLLIPPLLISMSLTFFCYPIICYNIGISSGRALGFIGRLVTLALGTPLINSLGGSVSLMAVCTILSGICGVLVGDFFFKILRIPSNDFVTRGVTLGINCGAIATAHLLNLDPRAASMSSLSFSLFGTIMIILASIGAVRDLLQSWVGL